MIALLRLYQLFVSPLLPPACRFEPSCSHYAIGALRGHGAARALRLIARRLWRCRPGGGVGYDPVPHPPTD